jgi:hypothetical protein
MPEYDSIAKSVRSSTHPSWSERVALPWWLRTTVVIGALLMATGALMALLHPGSLVSPHDEINGAVHIYAGYFAARNLALGLLLLAAMGLRARGTLNTLMLLTAFIQLLDAGIDCVEGRWIIAPGVVVFAVLLFLGSAALSGHPFWRVEAWRQGD